MDKNKKKNKNKKKRDTSVKFTDFLIPIVSGIIFLILLFFSFIPMLQEASSTIDKTEQVRMQQREIEETLLLVENLDQIELQNTLTQARLVVPNSLEVAEYAYYVDSLAEQKGLTFIGIKAEDQFSPSLGIIQNIQAVEAPIGYSGSFDAVTDFFNELQEFAPYIISMGDIEFRKNTTQEDEWGFEIAVTGYYSSGMEMPANLDSFVREPFRPYYQNNEDIMLMFSEKARKLDTD